MKFKVGDKVIIQDFDWSRGVLGLEWLVGEVKGFQPEHTHAYSVWVDGGIEYRFSEHELMEATPLAKALYC